MKTIRVLVVDDSSMARGLLRSMLEEIADVVIVGEAANGQQAVNLVYELKPDIVTMDLEMPVMDGLAAIDEIMHTQAVPILVVSSTADAKRSLSALANGALDVINKPTYESDQAAEFIDKLRMLAGVAVITRMRIRKYNPVPEASISLPQYDMVNNQIFVIAASTGGPQALTQILPALPENFPCPVLIAQHIADGFAQGMAQWLDSICNLPVKLAQTGDQIKPGHIYISPSEQNMVVVGRNALVLKDSHSHDVYRPSCDALLSSVAKGYQQQATGIIISGMGSDGVAGMAAIKQAGGITIAQSEASSVIYGMNKIAIDSGYVQFILEPAEIAKIMIEQAMGNLQGYFK